MEFPFYAWFFLHHNLFMIGRTEQTSRYCYNVYIGKSHLVVTPAARISK